MKIAVSSTGPGLDAEVDPHFGRCRHFIIADPETLEFEALENANINTSSGAGIASAHMLANRAVKAVLTGICGPNAYHVLAAAGVQVINGVSGRVRDAIEGYGAGLLPASAEQTKDPYFGAGNWPKVVRGRGMDLSGGRGLGLMPPAGLPRPPSPSQRPEARE